MGKSFTISTIQRIHFIGVGGIGMSALAAGAPGDILLFSPGFASFGLFKNEYERNDEFIRCINISAYE